MKHRITTSKSLIGLAIVVLFATAPQAFADATPDPVIKSAVFDTGKMPANIEDDAMTDETCSAADRKGPCKTASGFPPPLDMAASLFSAMTGCSRIGM